MIAPPLANVYPNLFFPRLAHVLRNGPSQFSGSLLGLLFFKKIISYFFLLICLSVRWCWEVHVTQDENEEVTRCAAIWFTLSLWWHSLSALVGQWGWEPWLLCLRRTLSLGSDSLEELPGNSLSSRCSPKLMFLFPKLPAWGSHITNAVCHLSTETSSFFILHEELVGPFCSAWEPRKSLAHHCLPVPWCPFECCCRQSSFLSCVTSSQSTIGKRQYLLYSWLSSWSFTICNQAIQSYESGEVWSRIYISDNLLSLCLFSF